MLHPYFAIAADFVTIGSLLALANGATHPLLWMPLALLVVHTFMMHMHRLEETQDAV